MDEEKCVCKSYTYVGEVDEHFFVVEHGNRFYLKLNLTGDSPSPPDNYRVVLHKTGTEELMGITYNTLKCDADSVDIQIVSKQHEDSYTLKYSNSFGETSLQFRLIVEGKCVSI